MEFVQRQALPAKLTLDTYLYASFAALACFISVMIPVILATKKNIVSQKRKHSSGQAQATWHKYFIDVILLAIAGYGWYTLRQSWRLVDYSHESIAIDPLLLLVPGLFIIGLTLLCFRIYPWIIAFITWIGRKKWPVHMYTALIQIGRTSKQYQFFMLFLVMTISIGLFSANTAQTVNQNLEEQVSYEAGADIVLQQYWERDIPVELTKAGEFIKEEDRRDNVRILYYEPNSAHIKDWPGIKQISRVFTKNRVNVTNTAEPNKNKKTLLMGIDTNTFGETAYFRSSLLSPNRHWFEYLNLMASETSSVMISRELAKDLDVRPGGYISLNWDMAQHAHFVVYDIIDYWPSWNPDTNPYFVVGNLSYIQNSMAIEPYRLWISLEEDADRGELLSKFEEERLRLTSFNDVLDGLNSLSKDAYLTGLNGSLTLGFLIALVITFIGFLLYWILSLRSRTLQYGVFRSMGMSARQLFIMLFWEQVLTTGMAVLLGVVIGKITSILFIPFLQNSLGTEGQLLPFRIVFERSDEILIYSFAGLLLISGLAILSWMISKIRIHQAIKIGEE
ncbi:ABC transporter permease [Bacillus alkalicellulosilyticus]|uniref:ABC transporter permease n=1 Tax=Alkalihalobacterium alkalicellulosilyticum TaxID=1912214 RepID=UPI000997AF1B|nr:ABC transporter permease [Bacillus alkalicellulosilyticus]